MSPEYERGWKAAMKYISEQHEIRAFERSASATGFGFMASAMAFMAGFLWIVRLLRFGEWWPWAFMLSVGFVTLAIYAFQAGKRDAAEIAEKRRQFKERWK